MPKLKFSDLLVEKDGLIKGPFGGDIKKEYFVAKGADTYKVYEQGVVLNRQIDYGSYYISSERFNGKLKRFEVKEGDILMTGAGTLGELYEIPKDHPAGLINQALLRIRLNKDVIDKSYFKYYFKSYIKSILSSINGDSVIPNLPPLSIIKETEVIIPNIIVQQKIASVFSTLDAKIELNNRINAELEAMAKLIYDYWFVQFDFPDQDGKPYKSSGGKMVWNETLKREIPEGWEDGELIDIANITMGQSPPGETYNSDGQGMVFYQGSTDFGTRFPTVRQFTTSPTRYAKKGEILLSVRAPVGTLNIALTDCSIGRGLASLSSKYNSNPFLFEVLKGLRTVFDRRNNDGTTFGSITKADLYSLKVVKAPKLVLSKFGLILNPMFELQNNMAMETNQLIELRDWLLPVLMNGQVKVT
jgi:type I restriction enzyme S subunit